MNDESAADTLVGDDAATRHRATVLSNRSATTALALNLIKNGHNHRTALCTSLCTNNALSPWCSAETNIQLRIYDEAEADAEAALTIDPSDAKSKRRRERARARGAALPVAGRRVTILGWLLRADNRPMLLRAAAALAILLVILVRTVRR